MAGNATAEVGLRFATYRSALRRWIEPPARSALAGLVVVAALTALIAGSSDAQLSAAAIRSLAVERLSTPGTSVAGSTWAPARGAPGTSAAASVAAQAPAYEFAWPLDGAVTTPMSAAHPTGIDIAATLGEPIGSIRAGVVKEAGGDVCCLYGYYVLVDHGDGWSSLYGHLSEILVQPGDRVEQGGVLGLAGDTGKATGVHLHLELWSSGVPVNPAGYLEPARYVPVPDAPVYVVQAEAEPAPTVASEPAEAEPAGAEVSAVSAGAAIDRAVLWMEVQGENGYQIDRGTCFAVAAGPNWSVSCVGGDLGCDVPAACGTMLEACVVGEERLVEAVCSGY